MFNGLLGWWLSHPDYVGALMWRNLSGLVHGTLELITSTAFRQSVRPGAFRSEFVLDGTAGRVAVPVTSFQPAGAITVACWAYGAPSGVRGLINHRESGASRKGYVMESDGTNVNFYVYVSGAYSGSPNGALSATVWTHWCATYDGATVRLYKNAVEQGGGTAATGAITYDSATSMYLGAEYISAGDRVWDGPIDDFQIYSRALSASEVGWLYDESRRGYPSVFSNRTSHRTNTALEAHVQLPGPPRAVPRVVSY